MVAAKGGTGAPSCPQSQGSLFLQNLRVLNSRQEQGQIGFARLQALANRSGETCPSCTCPTSLLQRKPLFRRMNALENLVDDDVVQTVAPLAYGAKFMNCLSAVSNVASIASVFGLGFGDGMSNEELEHKISEEIQREHGKTRELINENHREVMAEIENLGFLLTGT